MSLSLINVRVNDQQKCPSRIRLGVMWDVSLKTALRQTACTANARCYTDPFNKDEAELANMLVFGNVREACAGGRLRSSDSVVKAGLLR